MPFDRKEYQREYMRKRRANGKPNNRKPNLAPEQKRRRPRFDLADILARLQARREPRVGLLIPTPPPRVLPEGAKQFSMAMDSNIGEQIGWANAQVAQPILATVASEGLLFLGYAYLSLLAQRAEYRIPTETIATEMTRKWIKFTVAEDKVKKRDRHKREAEEAEAEQEELQPSGEEGAAKKPDNAAPGAEDEYAEPHEGLPEIDGPDLDDDEPEGEGSEEAKEQEEQEKDEKTEKIKQLEDEFERLQVRDCFKKIAMDDGFFGRAHLFLDFSEHEEEVDDLQGEMRTDIGDGRNDTSKGKVKQGSLKRIKVIEPVWTYPTTYNAVNPLREDWYNPTVWYVMGRELHVSRLLTFVGRPVPDLLKPSYMFGGLSLSQIAKPYVDLWLDTRKNIGNLIQAFSVMVLSTNLSSDLQTGGAEMFERAESFNALRDNAGLMMIDKNTEEFNNVAVPLGGLDHLQAQAQEHMMSVVRIPAVKFTGIQPSGLNASSEGEIRTFYDTIGAYQESFFRPNLTRLMHFIMLSLWGEIDTDITFEFNALWAMTEKEEAEIRKIEAETDDILVNGVAAIRPEEVRERIAGDPDTPYAGLDVADVPEPPDLQAQGLAMGGKVDVKGHQGFGGGPGGKGGGGGGNGEGGGQDAKLLPFLGDAKWRESDHPRGQPGNAGQFGPGGGGATKEPSNKEITSALGKYLKRALSDAPGWHSAARRFFADGAIGNPYEDPGQQANPDATKAYREMAEAAYAAGKKLRGGSNLADLLEKPAVAGRQYRNGITKAITEAKASGDRDTVKALQVKLIDSLRLSHERFLKKGMNEKAAAIAKKLAKFGAVEKPKPPAAGPKGKLKVAIASTEALARESPALREKIEGFVARVQQVADQLPEHVHTILHDIPIRVSRRSSTGGNYAGMYDYRGDIELPFEWSGGALAWNEANVLTHEAAHAIDHKYGWSLGRKVTRFVDQDATEMTESERRAAAYWFSDTAERFAELYALAYAPKNPRQEYKVGGEVRYTSDSDPTFFGGIKRERAMQIFKKSLAYLHSLDIGNPDGPAGELREKGWGMIV